MSRARRVLALSAVMALAAMGSITASAAERRIFSYDPADEATRTATGGLTFEFDQHLFSTHVLRVRATEGEATADLRSVAASTLGPGGVTAAVGQDPSEHDLYEVEPADQGEAMIQALCPGAKSAWLAFERLRANRDLHVLVIARSPDKPAKLCRSLAFTYRGEWRLPPGPGIDPRTIPTPRFPY